MFVTAGFIVGFDNEKAAMADAMIELIEDAAIPVAMVGLLYALPNTQLTRRLAKEGRLHELPEMAPLDFADQCTNGLNFDTLRPRREILEDYRRVLDRIYDPISFATRLRRLSDLLDNSNRKGQAPVTDSKEKFTRIGMLQTLMASVPEPDLFRETFSHCIRTNPRSARWVIGQMAFYLHLGPFSRAVIEQIDIKIARIDAEERAMAARERAAPVAISAMA
jgi:hypothetical protein